MNWRQFDPARSFRNAKTAAVLVLMFQMVCKMILNYQKQQTCTYFILSKHKMFSISDYPSYKRDSKFNTHLIKVCLIFRILAIPLVNNYHINLIFKKESFYRTGISKKFISHILYIL